jgi:hypothetical protein
MFGATPTEMNPERPFPVQGSVKFLEENSPAFRTGVMGKANLEKAYTNAETRLLNVGQEIEGLYAKTGGIPASISDISNHPGIQKLFDAATNPASVGKASSAASEAYDQVMDPIFALARRGNGAIDVKDLWALKRSIDDVANLETMNPSLADDYLGDARVAIKDAINSAIERAAPKEGKALQALNEEYHNLANVKRSMARGVSKTGGQLFMADDKAPLSLAGTVGKLSGIGTNTARAGAYNLGNLADATNKMAGPLGVAATQGASRGGAPLPEVPLAEAAKRVGAALPPMMSEAQAEPLLPRDTERLTSDALGAFMMKVAVTPQASIAQGLVSKLQKAFQAEDMDTVEKIHSDLTRLFPDLFEPGIGVNGKVFYPDEQAKVMDQLKQFHRMGMVDSIHLAKQQNTFNNPQDSRVLPMKQSQKSTYDGKPKFYEGVRTFSY